MQFGLQNLAEHGGSNNPDASASSGKRCQRLRTGDFLHQGVQNERFWVPGRDGVMEIEDASPFV
ncbi:MAG: hypothetical protein B9S30_04430 [Verrucomicrobiia bacterium Tous-C5FEB]|jgi:hypothetical protein|nr:MAG: hypothetical protein B9S30_04430 [Verrucomicrobiae bacterium Tous-C5FEB]